MTVKPYAIGSAIIIGAWLALVAVGALLNWTTGWSRDTLEAIIGGTGLVLAVAVIAQFQRRGLAFRHCLPVAVVVLGGLVAFFMLEYGL